MARSCSSHNGHREAAILEAPGDLEATTIKAVISLGWPWVKNEPAIGLEVAIL